MGIHYSPEIIQLIKNIDILFYLRQFEPQELVQISAGNYCTRTHDSLKISNGMWYWFSQGIGGRSALDYLIKVRGMSFPDAVGLLLECIEGATPGAVSQAGHGTRMTSGAVSQAGHGARLQPESLVSSEPGDGLSPASLSQLEKDRERRLVLPEAQEGYPARVVRYLVGRGIARSVIDYCIEHRLLYESKEYHNAVFVGYDAGGVARYAALRGTVGGFKGEVSGSDKHFSFSICTQPSPVTVHVFESAIDLLSYATLELRAKRDWRRDALLSLAGVFKQKREKVVPVALSQFLADHPSVRTLCLHLDNDEIGRSAATGIMEGLADAPYQIINSPPKYGKDVNDQLQWERLRARRNMEVR